MDPKLHFSFSIFPYIRPEILNEMQLAMSKEDMNECWSMMCDSVMHREGIGIIGEIDIEFITINGVDKVFH